MSLESLRNLARTRGYRVSRVMECVQEIRGDHALVDESHPSYPQKRPGLGDIVAAGLSAIGVTKERVAAVVGGPCACPERQAALNAAGAKWLGLPPGSTAPPEIDPPAQ